MKNVETKDHISMHQDHIIWLSDVKMWYRDIMVWKEELLNLEGSIKVIEDAFRNHMDGIKAHGEKVHSHSQFLEKHELDLKFLPEGSTLDSEIGKGHNVEMQQHLALRDTHERLKKYHHQILALIRGLLHALEKEI